MNYRLIVKNSQLLFPFLCILCIFHEVHASVASHNMFLTGIHLACNHRYGYYDLSGNYQSRKKLLPVLSPGIDFGKRFILTKTGGGIFYSGYQEQLREHDGLKKWLIDSYFIKRSKVTGSIDAGVFSELPFLNKNRLCFSYNFRYWQPVRYFVAKDLFPVNSIQYRERFFTQWLGVCILYRSPF